MAESAGTSIVLPTGDDWPIQRSKAATPMSHDPASSYGSGAGSSNDALDFLDEAPRGRKRKRTTSTRGTFSTGSGRRRGPRAISSRELSRETTRSDPLEMMIGTLSRDSELDCRVMEPDFVEPVPTNVAERILDSTPSPQVSLSSDSSPGAAGPALVLPEVQGAVSTEHEEDLPPDMSSSPASSPPAHRKSDPITPGLGFSSPSSVHRVSSPPNPRSRLTNVRDTFALLQQRTRSSTRIRPRGPSVSYAGGFEDLPFPAMLQLARLLDHGSFLAARRVCQSWSIALTHARPLVYAPSFRLPTEVLQTMYAHIQDPRDFDAARHTCRSWMAASLERRMLESMFRKGGWFASWVAERDARNARRENAATPDEEDEVWAMSKILARECALAATTVSTALSDQLDGASDSTPSNSRSSPFEQVLHADFSELSDAYTWVCSVGIWSRADPETVYGLRFTPSVCGRFLMAVDGYRIFVYRLGRSPAAVVPTWTTSTTGRVSPRSRAQAALHPVTSIVCPRRVLAISMDTSAGRHSVAVLMDDRMGLVCDLRAPGISDSGTPPEAADHEIPANESLEGEHVYWSTYPSISPYAPAPRYYQTAPTSILFGDDSPASSGNLSSMDSSYPSMGNMAGRPCPRHTSIPRENGPRRVYRAVGAFDDPPLSVAICPQRRCVAFGCAAGIELHWVDALTGHDLSRWFPLAAPSDYLFFLPPRAGVDSSKKLRLVSSARLPAATADISAGPSRAADTGGVPEGRHDRARGAADTFHAVPLSNGVHVLFTDPASGHLCIGSDAPTALPCRLSRKIMLEGPPAPPTACAIGRNLDWGARVVAAFGDELWFFSVPLDVLESDGTGQDEPWAPKHQESLPQSHPSPVEEQAEGSGVEQDRSSIWPVCISGQRVARGFPLVEVAIDSRQATLTLWAFSRDGTARAWQVRGADPRIRRVYAVQRDGSIMDASPRSRHEEAPAWIGDSDGGGRADFERDEDGDAVMMDAPPADPGIFEPRLHPMLRRQLNLDGSRSPVLDTVCGSLGDLVEAADAAGESPTLSKVGAQGSISPARSASSLPAVPGSPGNGMRIRFLIAQQADMRRCTDERRPPRYASPVGSVSASACAAPSQRRYRPRTISNMAMYVVPGHARPPSASTTRTSASSSLTPPDNAPQVQELEGHGGRNSANANAGDATEAARDLGRLEVEITAV